MSNLNKLFVYVPSNKVESFVTAHEHQNDGYYNKISFLSGTGEILTHGERFALNKVADISALQAKIGNEEFAAGLTGTTIISVINEIYGLQTDTSTRLADVSSRLNDLSTNVNASIGNINSSISNINSSISTLNSSVNTLETDVTNINSSISRLNSSVTALETAGYLTVEDTVGLLTDTSLVAGSVDYKVAQAKKEILTGDATGTISQAYDTILEIANWIENDQTGAASMANAIGDISTRLYEVSTRLDNASTHISEVSTRLNEVSTYASNVSTYAVSVSTNLSNVSTYAVEVSTRLNDVSSRLAQVSGNIDGQIEAAINLLDSSVILGNADAAQPSSITLDTSVEVIAKAKVKEEDGKLVDSTSDTVMLKVDPAGAAKLAYNTLLGTDSDASNALTIYGVKQLVEDSQLTFSGETGNSSLVQVNTVNGDVQVTSTQKLQDAVGLAETALQSLTVSTTDSSALTITGSPISKNSAQLTFTPNTGTISNGGDTSTLTYAAADEGKLATVDNVVSAINSIDLWENITE